MINCPRPIILTTVASLFLALSCSFGQDDAASNQQVDQSAPKPPKTEPAPKPKTEPANVLITVKTRDGRTMRGELDERTNEQHLWLQRSTSSISIRFSIRWDAIVSGQLGDRELAAAEFRQALKTVKPAKRVVFAQLQADNLRAGDDVIGGPETRVGRVATLQVHAHPANWDRDADRDGLEVLLLPLDEEGRVVQVSGSIRMQLFAQHTPRPLRPRSEIKAIEVWTKRIKASDYGAHGAVVRLPYRRIHPEFDLSISNDAIVTTRFTVHGQGVFHASAPLLLRSYDRLRDRLQLQRGNRFLPGERVRR